MRPPSPLALLFAGALSLAGCATLTGRPPEGPANEAAWQARLERLQALADWELSGRVGLINGKDGGSGSLDWKQQGEQLIFDFSGPLGSGAIHIQGDASALRVQSSRGDDFITDDPEQDFGEHLHMPMPVFSMRYWQLGIPDPGVPYTKTADAQGEAVSLEQRGWEVDYQEYAEVQGYSLPVRFTLSRGEVRIKVAVNTWNLQSAAPRMTP